jgi:hypothetical protein
MPSCREANCCTAFGAWLLQNSVSSSNLVSARSSPRIKEPFSHLYELVRRVGTSPPGCLVTSATATGPYWINFY